MEILNFKGPLSDLIHILKKGGSIHIKKKNRGKFTESAKRAGMGVQEYARHILANKDKYSSTLVKRANFARNAKKFKHENGGILKAQEGTGNLYAPHPLSPVGIALNQAKAMAKGKTHLSSGVKEVVGPDGKKVAIRTEQPLQSLEQSIAEVLPGTGDVAEVGYIANDLKNGNLGSAALAAGLMIVPGNIGKWFRKKKSPVVFPKYSSHFTEFLNKNRLSDDFTIKDIDDYIDQLDSNNPSENAMIRNWKNHKSFLITDDTYHKALTPQQIAEELPKMAVMGEPYVNDAQKELVSRYYAEQKFPRLIENFRKSGMNIEEGDFRYLKDLYSKPFDYVTVMTDYMPPGYGGFYDPCFEKIFVPENASITTLSHETHHALRDKLYDILKRYYKEVPNLPEGLGNTSKGEIYNSMDSRQFLPNEIELMEPLGMSKRYTGDKSPIKEIAAPVSGEIGLKKWMEFHDTYGRYPSPSELDDFIDKTLTMSQARNIGYGYQIGSKAVEEKGMPDHKLLEYYKNAAKYLGAGVGAFAVSKRLNSNNQENEPIN